MTLKMKIKKVILILIYLYISLFDGIQQDSYRTDKRKIRVKAKCWRFFRRI